jgi:TRAP-type uncharacterized transport system substrate-binding protein
LGVGAAIGTSGCLGAVGYRGFYELQAAALEDGAIEQILRTLSTVVHEESDRIRLRVEPVPDDRTALRRFASGEVNAPAVSNWSLMSVWNDAEAGDNHPMQGFGLALLTLHWVATEESGIETTDDLVGSDVFPLPKGWGLRDLIETIHETEGSWEGINENLVSSDVESVADAVVDGRIDAFAHYLSNGELPPWGREIDRRADLVVPEPTENWTRAIRNTSGPVLVDTTDYQIDRQSSSDAVVVEHPTSPYMQDVGPSEILTCGVGVQLLFGETVPDEAVFELARISHEYTDRLQRRMEGYPNHSRPPRTRTTAKINSGMYDFWIVDAPIHPGMAKFVDEYVSKHV